MNISEEAYLAHYGVLRRSGRYPWGSGGPEYATSRSFLGYVEKLRGEGLSETEIARGMGVTTTQLRAAKSIAKNEVKAADIAMAQRLKDKGYSNVAIGERMKINESSVRALLAPGQAAKADVLTSTANMLKDQVGEKKYIDIGTGVENQLGISQTKLSTAVARLQEEGYTIHYVKIPQLGTGQFTTMKVLAGPDVGYSEVFRNKADIKQIQSFSEDGGKSYTMIGPPKSIKSSRVKVRYAEEGGTDADGVIYVRRGVKDISLGDSGYAQVRIAVDGTHYLKGMAMYKDDLPDGVDLEFNTNKSNTGNKLDAMKKMNRTKDGAVDMENPFGAVVKRQSGVMNVVNEEGDWEKWSKSLSTQFLSKQSPLLAKTQLDMTYQRKQRELDEIMALTNPAVKKKLLESFSDDVDSSAVHLKAAALPRQGSHVILPVKSLKETEVFAPNYNNGDTVVLVRYPHGGIFEIPELKVNNRHPESRRLIGTNARDAIGINPKVAERLSGADFDGDTVLVIPNGSGKVKTAPALAGLKGFDPKAAYPAYEGMSKMSPKTKQIEMGKVSNLITDMTIRGASGPELARAVRHSMVVIDAEKHNLNYRQSEKDNGIAALKEKYQGGAKAGSATLISRATSSVRVAERKQGYRVDPTTGAKVFSETGTEYVNSKGQLVKKMTESTKLAEAKDARSLSSGTVIEELYASHSNRLKGMANQARLSAVNTKSTPYSPSARQAYSSEVASLNAKLQVALKNRPLERQAQLLANTAVSARTHANPDLEPSDIKKIKAQELAKARMRTGAGKIRVQLTDREWEAIQAGAISNNKLSQILNNADLDQVKALATPRTQKTLTELMSSRAKQLLDAGYTQAEVAEQLGVSVTTVKESQKG